MATAPALRTAPKALVLAAVLSVTAAPSVWALDCVPQQADILQMNLCNSGAAPCYEDGQAIPEATSLITTSDDPPDIVTVNEICLSDVEAADGGPGPLVEAMEQVHDEVDYNFHSSGVTCQDGTPYGNVVMVNGELSDFEPVEQEGDYHAQDSDPDALGEDGEDRGYACLEYPEFAACATHLSRHEETAGRQAEELMGLGGQMAGGNTISGGDFNLEYSEGGFWNDLFGDDSLNVQGCVPDGYYRKGNGGVMHIVSPDAFEFGDGGTIDMEHTDHSSLRIDVTIPCS
ncbi:hypothetical protein [Allonocardiopsis opalescens]|uniref:Endonuclease/exonuclease/phosphatase family protein n=1 Tax=Allonocardiopsis opalescens TaxID=1144618 RepID=A0A2T0QA10_9ACTN|nr:hypothetical protein [Allonocardiopsis opalescens]PRY00677.1 hypothetical protein CLV72_102308 [Allonocardiopsis opalescens]